jgi:predicted phage tail protein
MDKNIKQEIKVLLALLTLVIGIAATVYFGIWMLFINPVLITCAAFDAGTITAMAVGKTIIKCVFAKIVTKMILTGTIQIAEALCK